jgi:membrane-bound lytic murein transglycosylase D
MKKNLLSLVFTLVCFQSISQSIPETPLKVDFANVQIVLNSDSRQKINAEVQRLLTPQNSFFQEKVERMQLYFPIIERILEEENVPDDFKYLAVLESALNADAVSSTNAVGFWQFKDFTAEEMGLSMNRNQDDRKNLQLSTRAAAQYLKKNNQIFKNWISTTLSYTVGAGGAASIIPVDWSFANEVRFENTPHPYLIKAIGHKIAFQNHLKKAGKANGILIEYPAKGKSIAEIATEVRLPESELRKYNTWLSANSVPTDKDYVVLIKTDRTNADLITSKAKNLVNTDYINIGYPKLKRVTMVVTSTDQPVFYEINDKKGILAQPGDEAAQLARKGKVSISKFLGYNDMSDRDLTKEGTVYYLQKKYKKGDVPYHTLNENQSLWDVAHNYGIRLKNLKKFNRIKESEPILPGRVLYLQKKRPKKEPVKYNKALVAPPEVFSTDPKNEEIQNAIIRDSEVSQNEANGPRPKVHRVLENETLFSLANKYGTTVEEIRKLNNLKPTEGIQYNQRLAIPEAKYTTEPEDNWEEKEETKPVLMPEKKPVTQPAVSETPKPSSTKLPTASTETSHNVRPGETLFSIANRYGTTVDELRRMNNLTPFESLKAGQSLRVNGGSSIDFGTDRVKTIEPDTRTKTTTHTVSGGETLFSISNRYGITVDELRALNGISGNTISVGQKLRVSGPSLNSAPSSGGATTYHTVKAGETLFSLSQKYGVTVNEIKSWNNMTSNNLVKGKRVIVRK